MGRNRHQEGKDMWNTSPRHVIRTAIEQHREEHTMGVLVAQSCVTLWTPWTVARQAPMPMEFWIQNTRMGSHSLLQGIFQNQGLNSGLPHCRQILYHQSHQGSPTVRVNVLWKIRDIFLEKVTLQLSLQRESKLPRKMKQQGTTGKDRSRGAENEKGGTYGDICDSMCSDAKWVWKMVVEEVNKGTEAN